MFHVSAGRLRYAVPMSRRVHHFSYTLRLSCSYNYISSRNINILTLMMHMCTVQRLAHFYMPGLVPCTDAYRPISVVHRVGLIYSIKRVHVYHAHAATHHGNALSMESFCKRAKKEKKNEYYIRSLSAENFAGTNLSLNGSTYYTLLSDAQTRAPGQYVFSVGYTRTLGSQETVSVTLSGTLSALFTALRSGPGYTVFTSAVLPSGRYPFGLIAYLTVTGGYPSLVTVAAIVEVFSQSELCDVITAVDLFLINPSPPPPPTTTTTLLPQTDHACVNQTFGICSQICTECNISSTCKYGYLCSCLEGYSLQLDGYSCLANGTSNPPPPHPPPPHPPHP